MKKVEIEQCCRIAFSGTDKAGHCAFEQSKRVISSIKVQPDWGDIHILMVDDDSYVAGSYLPYLIARTRGAASMLLFRGEDLHVLVERIRLAQPAVLLMDMQLADVPENAEKLSGVDIFHHIPTECCSCRIGFSSSCDNERSFRAAGAHGFVTKRLTGLEIAMNDLGNVLRELGIFPHS